MMRSFGIGIEDNDNSTSWGTDPLESFHAAGSSSGVRLPVSSIASEWKKAASRKDF
jgi:hypothetical protein